MSVEKYLNEIRSYLKYIEYEVMVIKIKQCQLKNILMKLDHI